MDSIYDTAILELKRGGGGMGTTAAHAEWAYAGTVKRHNVCKCQVAIDTGVKQTEHTIFLHVISMGLKL